MYPLFSHPAFLFSPFTFSLYYPFINFNASIYSPQNLYLILGTVLRKICFYNCNYSLSFCLFTSFCCLPSRNLFPSYSFLSLSIFILPPYSNISFFLFTLHCSTFHPVSLLSTFPPLFRPSFYTPLSLMSSILFLVGCLSLLASPFLFCFLHLQSRLSLFQSLFVSSSSASLSALHAQLLSPTVSLCWSSRSFFFRFFFSVFSSHGFLFLFLPFLLLSFLYFSLLTLCSLS